jgi:hypothetical protein
MFTRENNSIKFNDRSKNQVTMNMFMAGHERHERRRVEKNVAESES